MKPRRHAYVLALAAAACLGVTSWLLWDIVSPPPASPPPPPPPLPPLAPGESYAYVVRASFVVEGTVENFNANEFRKELAQTLNVSSSDIHNVTTRAGSIVVTADVSTPSSDERERVADILRSAEGWAQLSNVVEPPTVELVSVALDAPSPPPPPPPLSPPPPPPPPPSNQKSLGKIVEPSKVGIVGNVTVDYTTTNIYDKDDSTFVEEEALVDGGNTHNYALFYSFPNETQIDRVRIVVAPTIGTFSVYDGKSRCGNRVFNSTENAPSVVFLVECYSVRSSIIWLLQEENDLHFKVFEMTVYTDIIT
jgi:hypothetical protein